MNLAFLRRGIMKRERGSKRAREVREIIQKQRKRNGERMNYFRKRRKR